MNEALKRMLFSSRYPASRFSISRVASETSLTTSNIVRAPIRLVAASPSAQRCLNTLMTARVPARFAELGEVIHAGMRPGVRGENHALVEHYADTVGHAMRLLCIRTPFAMPPASGWR